MKMKNYILYLFVLVFMISSCQGDIDNINTSNISDVLSALPESVNYPTNNPYSLEKENLGRLLFWDPVLSGKKDISCASCHHPDFGYSDGLDLSQGVDGNGLGPNRVNGTRVKRNSQTIINSAFNGIDNDANYRPENAPMFWDLRVESLEEQALKPMLSKEEMRGEDIAEAQIMDVIIQRLNNIDEYKTLFEKAFGTDEINQDRILKAIATFERVIIANDSRFDRYMKGDQNALSNRELRGLQSFVDVGCADCHGGPMLSDFELHTLGVPDHLVTDTGANGDFDFRTPTLRNVELTAPYMHNGIFNTLEEVVEFYEDIADGEEEAINNDLRFNELDDEVRDLDLDGNEIGRIVAFLKTLTDEDFDKEIPNNVPSNLPVGGNIQ